MERWSAVTALVAREAAHTKNLRNMRFLFLGVVVLLPGGMFISALLSGRPILLFEPTPQELTGPLLRGLVVLIAASIGLYGLSAGGAAARRIALERRQNTWTLFRLAPVGGLEMATAHWCASLLPFAVWTAMHIPIVTFLLLCQAASQRAITLSILAIVILSCLAASAINVMASAAIKHQRLAGILTSALVVTWGLLLHVLVRNFFLTVGWLEQSHPYSEVARRIDTFLVDLSPVRQLTDAAIAGRGALGFAVCCTGLVLVIGASLTVAAAFFKRENPYAALAKRVQPANVGMAERIRKTVVPRRCPIRDGVNPFLIQELRAGYLGYPLLALFYFSLPTVAFFWLSTAIARTVGELDASVGYWLIFVLAPVLLMGSRFAGPMIARERDANTFDLMVLTGCTPGEILRGKLGAAVLGILPFFVIGLGSYLPMWLEGGRQYALVMAGFASVAVCMLVQQSAGLCASILSRNARDAASLSTYLGILCLIGGPILVMFGRGIVFDLQTAVDISYAPLSFTSPLFAIGYFAWVTDDRMRGVYLVLTLWLFAGLAWALFRGAVGLLRRQMAGAGRHAAGRQTETD